MGNTRRKLGVEFKREAVTAVTQDVDVHKSVLRRWIKELDSGAAGKVTELSSKNEQSQEIERLKRELARVKMERDIKKKALGDFAKNPS